MRPQFTALRAVLALLALGACLLASQPAAAEEYSPLNSPSTYNKPGEAPENQARFLMASLADRQRLAGLELEMQTLTVQPNPEQARIAELDRQVKDLRAKVDKMATDMGGYIPALRHRAGDCEKTGDRRRDDFGRGRGMGRGGSRGPEGW
ncbi:MAG: hypothetical protein HY910_12950 [Desulfarculus sp.]|nr:hypothetical protein [Desulfarculus sp.]